MEKEVKYDVNTVLEIYEMKQLLYSQREKTAKEIKAFSNQEIIFEKKYDIILQKKFNIYYQNK